jgi:hypothetical protein
MSKHIVHMFAVVGVKVCDVEAASHEEAVKAAVGSRVRDFDTLFDTTNYRHRPYGVTNVEFGDEFSHFIVDETDDKDYVRTTWHDSTGRTVPCYFRRVVRPLTAKEFKALIDANGRVRFLLGVSLGELVACGDICRLNELMDARIYGDGVTGSLTDISYRPVIVEDELILIEVNASAEEIVLD